MVHMERLTPQCMPLCGQVGHRFVTIAVWRCDHHGALSAVVSAYTDTEAGPALSGSSEWLSGPFTADLDLEVLMQSIRNELLRLSA